MAGYGVDPDEGLNLDEPWTPPAEWGIDAPDSAATQYLPPEGEPGEPLFPWETPAALQVPTPSAPPPTVAPEGAGPTDLQAPTLAPGAVAPPPYAPPPPAGPAAPPLPWEGAPPPPAPPLDTDQASRDLVRQGPEAVAAAGVNLDQDRADYVAAEHRRALANDERQRAADERTMRVAQDSTRREIAALRAQVVEADRGHVWADKTVPQQIAGYIQAIIGGLQSPYTDGRNLGLESVMQGLDRDVEVKRQNLASQIGMVGDAYQASLEDFRHAEANRIANLGQLDKTLARKAAEFDPAGTRVQALTEARLQVRQKQAEAMSAAEEKLYKRGQDEAELQIKQDTLAEQKRSRYASQAQARELAVAGEKRWAYENQAIFDPTTGRWIRDANATPAALKPSDVKTNIEIDQLKTGVTVHDARGKLIGTSRGGVPSAAKNREAVAGYEDFRSQLAVMQDKIDKAGRAFGWKMGRWPTEIQSEIEGLHTALGFRYARALNGAGVLSNADVTRAEKGLPELETLTTDRDPRARYRSATALADSALDKALGVEVEGYDPKTGPVSRYQALDRLREPPPKTVKREELMNEISVPLAPETSQDPEYRQAAIVGRVGRLAEIGLRSRISDEEINALGAAFKKQLDAGLLSPEEHKELTDVLGNSRTARQHQLEAVIPDVPDAGLAAGIGP